MCLFDIFASLISYDILIVVGTWYTVLYKLANYIECPGESGVSAVNREDYY